MPSMEERLQRIRESAQKEMERIRDKAELELVKAKHLGRKSELNELLKGLKDKAEEERQKLGPMLQGLREEIEQGFEKAKESFRNTAEQATSFDVTAPGKRRDRGHVHPLTQAQMLANEIFASMGFSILEGPEVETPFNNFDALNIPADHPARTMMDTFWLKERDDLLMRTHTSPMQVRYMQKHRPPFRIIVPGRMFRNEATDATHEFQFHQIEGLMVSSQGERGVSMANLKGVLEHFFRTFFNDEAIRVRFNASYFPFTEPSVEVFIQGTSGRLKGKWIEVAGAGMVHQNVFKAVGYVPGEFQGFAFGMGFERIVMLKHKIDDVRLFESGDMRFLSQF